MNLWNFSEDIVAPFNRVKGLNGRFDRAEVKTIHDNTKAPLKTIWSMYPLLRGLCGYGDRKFFIARTSNGSVAEILEQDGTRQIAIASKKAGAWDINLAQMNPGGGLTKYPETRKGMIYYLALMPDILADSETNDILKEFEEFAKLEPDAPDWDYIENEQIERMAKIVCKFSNNLFYRIKKGTSPYSVIEVNEITSSLKQKDIDEVRIESILRGSSELFTNDASTSFTHVDFSYRKYPIDAERVLTEDEKKLIPTISDSYVTPKWVESLAGGLCASNKFESPFRNILLTGPSGSGKTSGTRALAAMLGLPYVKITCSPDTDMFEFMGQLIPNVKDKSVEEISELDIPSWDDVELDFEGTYEKLFGVKPGKYAQESDCYMEINKRTIEQIRKKDGKDFTFVESDFIKAIRNGWFCEIQEPTVIKRNSVMVGLNSLMESYKTGASFTLATGENVKRHKDAVICLTTNSDYDGCDNIQQSVLSRMDYSISVPNPSVEELVARTVSSTGFSDVKTVRVMSEMVESINKACYENDITKGICGPRELANWAKQTIILSEINSEPITDELVCLAAFSTLLNKVSQDAEDVEIIINECLRKRFTGNDFENARRKYLEGAF